MIEAAGAVGSEAADCGPLEPPLSGPAVLGGLGTGDRLVDVARANAPGDEVRYGLATVARGHADSMVHDRKAAEGLSTTTATAASSQPAPHSARAVRNPAPHRPGRRTHRPAGPPRRRRPHPQRPALAGHVLESGRGPVPEHATGACAVAIRFDRVPGARGAAAAARRPMLRKSSGSLTKPKPVSSADDARRGRSPPVPADPGGSERTGMGGRTARRGRVHRA